MNFEPCMVADHISIGRQRHVVSVSSRPAYSTLANQDYIVKSCPKKEKSKKDLCGSRKIVAINHVYRI